MSWRGREEPPALRPGLLKICAGIVEEATGEPYRAAIDAARRVACRRQHDAPAACLFGQGYRTQPHQSKGIPRRAAVLHPSASHRQKAVLQGAPSVLSNAARRAASDGGRRGGIASRLLTVRRGFGPLCPELCPRQARQLLHTDLAVATFR